MTKKKTAKRAVKKTKKVVKKIVRKTVKNTPKKLVKKSTPIASRKKKAMPTAEGEKCFWVYEGPVVKDLRELRDALERVSEKQYLHHVNKMKNDFASWIEEILDDKETARAARKAKTLDAMIRVLEKSLPRYF